MARTIDIPNNEMNRFDLPPICIVTGRTEGVVFKPVKFSWYPRWIAIFAPFALLIAAILAAILTKRSKGELPFTEEAWRKWKLGQVMFALSFVAAIGTLIGMGIAFGENAEGLGFLLLALTFVLPIGVGVGMLRGRGPSAQKITDSHTSLKLPSDSAADAIARHLVGGAAKKGPAIVGAPGGVAGPRKSA